MTCSRFIASVLLLIAAHQSLAGDWPNWRGPNLDGVSKETGWDPEKIDSPAWTAEVGIGFASVAVSDGRLYTLGHDGTRGKSGKETVFCLNAKTGKKIWTKTYEAELLPRLHEGGPAATPTVHDGRVYTLSKNGRLLCHSAKDGKRHWERNLLVESKMDRPAEWGFASSPLILGETLIVEADQTLAFHKDTGKPQWKSKAYKAAYGSPTAFTHKGNPCLATVKNDGLVILDARNGKTLAFEKWKTRFSTNANTPIVRGDKIFISTGYQRGCGLFQFTGARLKEIYTSENMSTHMSNCVLLGDYLYGFDGNTHTGRTRRLRCIELATGKVQWSESGLGIGAVCAAGNRLIVLSEKGEIVVATATPKSFQPSVRAQASSGRHWNVPVLANGFLYIRNAAGRLSAHDLN